MCACAHNIVEALLPQLKKSGIFGYMNMHLPFVLLLSRFMCVNFVGLHKHALSIEGPRGKVDQPTIKYGELSKHHKNALKSEAYPSEKHEIFLTY